MYCSRCGNELKPGARFCSSCGCPVCLEKNELSQPNDGQPAEQPPVILSMLPADAAKEKKGKKAPIIAAALVLLALVGGALGFFTYRHSAQAEGYETIYLCSGETCYEADGSLSWQREYTYDSAGNELSAKYYDSDGSPSGLCYEYTYDSAGNKLSEKYYDYQSDGSLYGSLYYQWEYTYDSAGNELSDKWYDCDGKLSAWHDRDMEIYVDRLASMQIDNLNNGVDITRQIIAEQYQPDERGLHFRTLELAHIHEDEYFSYTLRDDLTSILHDIRQAHVKDTVTAPQTSVAEDFRKNVQEVIEGRGTAKERLLKTEMATLGIDYDKLTPEEIVIQMGILEKSKLLKNAMSQRGRSSPYYPPHGHGKGKKRK